MELFRRIARPLFNFGWITANCLCDSEQNHLTGESARPIGLRLGRMASNAKLVSIGVTEISAVVVLVILGPQTWCALRNATMGQSGLISAANRGPALCEKSHHLSVARLMRLLIVGLSDNE